MSVVLFFWIQNVSSIYFIVKCSVPKSIALERQKKSVCVFQVSKPYLDCCPDPKHFIVNCEQNDVKLAGNGGGGGNVLKNVVSI